MRTSPHGAPNREIEPGASQPDQWTTQSGSVPHRGEAGRNHSQEDVIIPPGTSQQAEEQSAQRTEIEPNPLNIEIRTQDEDMGTVRENDVQGTQPLINVILPTGLSEQIQDPNVNISVSKNNSETSRGSHVRSQELGM